MLNEKQFRLKQVVGVGMVGARGLGYTHTILRQSYLSLEREGKHFSVLCPVCFTDRVKWLNWREAKILDIPCWVYCVNGHRVPKGELLIGNEIKGV